MVTLCYGALEIVGLLLLLLLLLIVIVDTQLHKQITNTPEPAKITHVYYTIQHEGGCHIDFQQCLYLQADYG